jgi:hypothetical protein
MIEFRTMPMIYTENRFSKDHGGQRDPCACCGREMKSKTRFWIHLIMGGGTLLHPDDTEAYGTDDPGEMGWHPVGSACAKKFGEYAVKDIIPVDYK